MKSLVVPVLILSGVFGAALFAAQSIVAYQEVTQRELTADKIATELGSNLAVEHNRNVGLIPRATLAESDLAGFVEDRKPLIHLIADLERVKGNEGTAPRIRSISEQYWAAIDDLMKMNVAGQFIEVRASLLPKTAPLHEERMAIVEEAKARYENQAEKAAAGARLATMLITIGGALSTSVLFLAVTRQRTSSQLSKLRTRMVEESEARFRTLIQNAASIITIVNEAGNIQYQSATVKTTLGYEPTDLVQDNFASLVHPDDEAAYATMMRRTLEPHEEDERAELRLKAQQGAWVETEVVAQNLTDDAYIHGVVLTAHDIRERKTLENRLTQQALHDPLTGLPNRMLFRDRLTHALDRGNRPGRKHCVMFLDLDDFKLVNDSLGHMAGDQYLITVGKRLSSMVRSRDTVARFGGDEFAVLLENASEEEVELISGRLMGVFQEPFSIEGRSVQATASLGIVSTDTDRDPGDLLRDADTAMYIAKARGKGRCEVFTPAMHAAVVDRMDLEHELREGIARDQFKVHYQPIIGFDSQHVVGLEALVRWEHPKRGLLMPEQFIGVAEETGLIIPLGETVLKVACQQIAKWQKHYKREIMLTVNLSAREFTDSALLTRVTSTLEKTGLPASSLVLEITETVLARNTPALVQRLQDLRAGGLRLAIDDFGTGYSSLSYLQDFPVDIVKIDKSFIDGLNGDKASAALPQAIISLARALNLQTIAEGVERAEQADQLRAIGCDLWQGYHFARPLSQSGIEKLLTLGVPRLLASVASPAAVLAGSGEGHSLSAA